METHPQGFDENYESNIRTWYWREGVKTGLTLQDLENEDSWLAMRDGLDLRKWA